MTVTVSSGVATAEEVLAALMKVEPTAAAVVGAVVPGAAPIIAMVQPEIMILAPFITNALDALSKGNNQGIIASLVDLIQHITPGEANSHILQPASGT